MLLNVQWYKHTHSESEEWVNCKIGPKEDYDSLGKTLNSVQHPGHEVLCCELQQEQAAPTLSIVAARVSIFLDQLHSVPTGLPSSKSTLLESWVAT